MKILTPLSQFKVSLINNNEWQFFTVILFNLQ